MAQQCDHSRCDTVCSCARYRRSLRLLNHCSIIDVSCCTLQEAKKLFAALTAKLDALSHLSLAPKPVTTELEVRVDTPAIAMEEAAPVTMSAANMRAPEELHAQVCSLKSADRCWQCSGSFMTRLRLL